jgi:hypothetical protein
VVDPDDVEAVDLPWSCQYTMPPSLVSQTNHSPQRVKPLNFPAFNLKASYPHSICHFSAKLRVSNNPSFILLLALSSEKNMDTYNILSGTELKLLNFK